MAHSIYCPNPLCQAANPIEHRSCQNCGSYIPHYYLWVPSYGALNGLQLGGVTNDRYLLVQEQVVLDLKPSQIPIFTEEVDDWAIRYAELFPYRSTVPQIYAYLEQQGQFYRLLENNAVYQNDAALGYQIVRAGQPMPEVAALWEKAHLEQQISWISQIFQLWQPLGRLGLTETLLRPELVRVDGSQIHILQLEQDSSINPSIADFAVVWGDLLDWGYSAFWSDISRQMIQGEILNSDQVLSVLDQRINMIHLQTPGSQGFAVDISTLTDKGPSRSENQDACYPNSKTYFQSKSNQNPWLVVCDGIGGHEGGSLASKLAIEAIEQSLRTANLTNCSADDVEVVLEQAIFLANDRISERNDKEQREDKKRMGTTVVLAYVRENQLFISHVGDSRAYRITRAGCNQVTVDDDLASREAMYGSAFYREALQYPGTGALTQALGMSSSQQLQPTTQRFWLTESCIYLLCSDGLSDFDLLDRLWSTEVTPVFQDRSQLRPAAQRLVTLANEHNGHDNVTVGLLHVMRPAPIKANASTQVAVPQQSAARGGAKPVAGKTKVATIPRRSGSLRTAFFSLLVLGLLGGGSFAWWRSRQAIVSEVPIVPASPSSPVTTTGAIDADAVQEVNQILQVVPGPVPVMLMPPPDSRLSDSAGIELPPGTIVQVTGQLTTAEPESESWVKLKVCSVPPANVAGEPTAVPAGTDGWQKVAQLVKQVTLATSVSPEQLGICDPDGTAPDVPPPSGNASG